MLRFIGEQQQQENLMLPILYPCVKSQTSLGLGVRYAGLCVFLLPKTCVVGTQKSHLNKMVLFSIEPKHMQAFR